MFTGVVHSHAERIVQGLSGMLNGSGSDRCDMFVSEWDVPREVSRWRKSGLVEGGRGMQL